MAQTEEGAICLALCAALQECYDVDVAIEVLLALSRESTLRGEPTPSSMQWRALLECCAGCLANSNFALIAEQLMSFSGDQNEMLGLYASRETRPKNLRGCSSPESIAKALLGIGRVTRRELESITIIGGSDAGWLAALGTWLFGCTVRITHADGTLVYDTAGKQTVQLSIIYKRDNESGSVSEHLEVKDRTYLLEDAFDIFFEDHASFLSNQHVVSGRLSWDTALARTFMADFSRLISLATTLSQVIGSAARIFQGIVNREDAISSEFLNFQITASIPASYGIGLIDQCLQWFPELSDLRNGMQNALRSSLVNARQAYDVSIIFLRDACQCDICQTPATGFDMAELEQIDIFARDDLIGRPYNRFCLVVLAETIIHLTCDLAQVEVVQGLTPVRSGLELRYTSQLSRRIRPPYSCSQEAIKSIGQIIFLLASRDGFSNPSMSQTGIINALHIFTGRPTFQDISNNMCAASRRGICAIVSVLRNPVMDQESAGRILVMPGHIELENKVYDTLMDTNANLEDECDLQSLLTEYQSWSGEILKLSVAESANYLRCCFKIFQSEGPESSSVYIGPAKMANMLCDLRRQVRCTQDGMCRKASVRLSEMPEITNYGGCGLALIKGSSKPQSLLALALASGLERSCLICLVDSECGDCCVRLAVEAKERGYSHVCFLKLWA